MERGHALIDWGAIEVEYVTSAISIRELAERHNVSKSALERRCSRGNWVKLRRQNEDKVRTKTAEKIIESKSTAQAEDIFNIDEWVNDMLHDCRSELEHIGIGEPEIIMTDADGTRTRIESSIDRRSKLIRTVIALAELRLKLDEVGKMESIAKEGIQVVVQYV